MFWQQKVVKKVQQNFSYVTLIKLVRICKRSALVTIIIKKKLKKMF